MTKRKAKKATEHKKEMDLLKEKAKALTEIIRNLGGEVRDTTTTDTSPKDADKNPGKAK